MTRARLLVGLSALALTQPRLAGAETAPACPLTRTVRAQPPRDPNADAFGNGPWFVNGDRSIWAGWDAVRMVAGPRGSKVLWIRPQGTQLNVTGRRLDADSPPLQARVDCCSPAGFLSSRLFFPAEGCWEVSATSGGSELTFVTRVRPAPRRR